MPDQEASGTVLIVDDEREVADLYASALADEYAVQTAYSGEEALDLVDHEPDVILLDRRMPGLSGDEVLAEVRARGVDARVAMVTAADPDFDIIEMEFDDYVVKPVGPADLNELVERLRLLDRLEETRVELSSKRVTRNVLEVEKREAELKTSPEYAKLVDRIEELETEIDRIEAQLDDEFARSAAKP